MAAKPGEQSWFWERHMQLSLARDLKRQGWTIEASADTETKATGIDLLATIGHRKPTQPASQAGQWFSYALLGMMLLRDKRPDAEIALGVPRFLTYERLLTCTRGSFEMLGFGAYLVDEGAEQPSSSLIDQSVPVTERTTCRLRRRSADRPPSSPGRHPRSLRRK